MPAVAVLIPTHNRSDLLRLTLENVLTQTHTDLQVFVVDDNSSDDTPEVLAAFAKQDPRLRFERVSPGKGASAARNRALAATDAPYVNYLDSDDLMHPTKLERHVAFLEAHPDVDLVVSQMAHFEQEPGDDPYLWNTFAGDSPRDRFLGHDPVWGIHAPLWRRETLTQLNGLDERWPMAQDWELHVRALLRGARVQLDSTLLTYCRRHQGGSIGNDKTIKRLKVLADLMDVLEPQAQGENDPRILRGNRLWLANLACASGDGELADRLMQQGRASMAYRVAGWGLRTLKRHVFHRMMRSLAAKDGFDLDRREKWLRSHRIDQEPGLTVPAWDA